MNLTRVKVGKERTIIYYHIWLNDEISPVRSKVFNYFSGRDPGNAIRNYIWWNLFTRGDK